MSKSPKVEFSNVTKSKKTYAPSGIELAYSFRESETQATSPCDTSEYMNLFHSYTMSENSAFGKNSIFLLIECKSEF